MKIISLVLLVGGLFLTFYGLNAIGELGHDLVQFFSSVTRATQILPLAVGIVMVVVSIAGMLPGTADATRAPHQASDNKSTMAD